MNMLRNSRASLKDGLSAVGNLPSATSSPKQGYLPTLDGWRAVAILAVIQYHGDLYQAGWLSNRFVHENGFLGVDLFFAISGFLICSRLLEESRTRGYFSLGGFYIRRCFRILPAAWAYLLVCAILSCAKIIPVDWGGLIASLLTVRNLWAGVAGDTPTHWYTIHFWSLSVEEHFYLLLPGLLVIARGKKTAVTAAAALLTTVWTLIIVRMVHLQTPGVWLRTDERLSSLMVPAFFAVLLGGERVRDIVVRWLHPWVAVLVFCLVYAVGLSVRTLQPLDVIYGFPLLIISTTYHPFSWSGRVLELGPLRFVGHISYSLYLWQQLFFLLGHQGARWPLSLFQHFPMNYVAAFSVAVGSYYLLEKPCIRLGHRIARPLTEGREELVLVGQST